MDNSSEISTLERAQREGGSQVSRKGPLEVRELLCELSEHLNRRITVAERKGYECSKVPVGELEE